MQPAIRDAVPGDCSAIARLLGTLGYPVSAGDALTALQRFAERPGSRVQVALLDDKVVGFVATHIVPRLDSEALSCRVVDLVVDEAEQRAGVGTALMAAAEGEGRAQGVRRMDVSSSEHRREAHAFYEALGFKATGRNFAKRLP